MVNARVIAMCIQKGGSAKTTSVVNLADSLSRRGQRVLVIDLDPQCHSTMMLSCKPVEELAYNVGHFLLEPSPNVVANCVMTSRLKGVSLIPSSIRLARRAESDLVNKNTNLLAKRLDPPGRPGIEPLPSVLKNFDIVLIDCPPNLGRLTVNALCAADYFLVPLAGGDFLGLEGFEDMLATVDEVTEDNPRLRFMGIFLTKFDGRLVAHREMRINVQDRYGGRLLKSSIPRSVLFDDASSVRKTVLEADRRSLAARAYVELADEVLAVIERDKADLADLLEGGNNG